MAQDVSTCLLQHLFAVLDLECRGGGYPNGKIVNEHWMYELLNRVVHTKSSTCPLWDGDDVSRRVDHDSSDINAEHFYASFALDNSLLSGLQKASDACKRSLDKVITGDYALLSPHG